VALQVGFLRRLHISAAPDSQRITLMKITINPTQLRERRATSRKNDFAKQVIVRKQETHKLVSFLYNL